MVIYTDPESSMQSIECNKEKHSILNQKYSILAELRAKDKKITLCIVLPHMGIKVNKEADKSAKEAIYVPGMTTIRLSYTDYYMTI